MGLEQAPNFSEEETKVASDKVEKTANPIEKEEEIKRLSSKIEKLTKEIDLLREACKNKLSSEEQIEADKIQSNEDLSKLYKELSMKTEEKIKLYNSLVKLLK